MLFLPAVLSLAMYAVVHQGSISIIKQIVLVAVYDQFTPVINAYV